MLSLGRRPHIIHSDLTLTSGSRLGAYEITAQIGEGGMGQVFRATDTKLKRQVAIKILPPSVAADHDRLARFQREAEVLASLNHPHIAGIYGLEESPSTGSGQATITALVMELVDGEDLSQRIARGAISIDDALPIAKQIAEALEAAHEQGIIHRDLKPANIKVRSDGTVKVLDFGLAKAIDTAHAADSRANSPTITSPAITQAGIILGTAAYMSPEQARGKLVDRRADLWALGCVLYEMLTASRAFDGETITDVLSAVVSKEPDWAKLPRETPTTVQRLLRRSLRKDVRTRLQSAGEARVELEEALAAPATDSAAASPAASKFRWLPALAFAAAGAALAFVALSLMRPPAAIIADPPAMRFTITLPPTMSLPGGSAPTISPDGRWIAISAQGPIGSTGERNLAVWLRPIDGQAFQPIAGTEQAITPFWSPDSRELAFFVRSTLNRISITGGTPTRVADVGAVSGAPAALAAAWGVDGTILLSSAGRIYRVPASGGTLTEVPTPEAGSNVIRSAPSWLPGNRFLFSEIASGVSTGDGIGGLFMQSLAGGAPTQLVDGRTLARHTADGLLTARYTVTGVNVGTIRAHRFDIERGTIDQPGVVLAADVNALFGVSDTGVLVYRRATAGADHRLQWVDRKGRAIGDGFDVAGSGPFNLSRDERLVAFQEANDIMVRDLVRGVTTRVVQGPGVLEPILSPDGRRVAYSKIVPPQIGIAIRPTAGGPEDVVFTSPDVTLVEDWSRDGRFLLAIQSSGQRNPNRGVIIPLEGEHTPVVFADLPTGSGLDEPRFSHDGKWVVYNAADSGRQQVYLTPVPPTGERWQLSTDGGAQGRWRSDDGAVYYLSASGQLMEVAVTKQQPPQIGRPQVLFDTGLEMASNIDQYLPNGDGTRFLLRRPRGNAGGVELQVIVNWPTLLNQVSRQ